MLMHSTFLVKYYYVLTRIPTCANQAVVDWHTSDRGKSFLYVSELSARVIKQQRRAEMHRNIDTYIMRAVQMIRHVRTKAMMAQIKPSELFVTISEKVLTDTSQGKLCPHVLSQNCCASSSN